MRALVLAGLAAVGIALLAAGCGGGGGDEETPAATETAAATETGTATATEAADEEPPTAEEVAAAFETARAKLQEAITAAQAGDAEATAEAFEIGDEEGLHIIVDALDPVDPSLADDIDAIEHEQVEDELDKGNPDLTVVAQGIQDLLSLLDQAEQAIEASP